MKHFEQRSYRHKAQRPLADYKLEDDGTLFSVSFSWGEINPNEKIYTTLSNYFFASKNDIEVTSPFEIIPSLTALENKIRTSMLIANAEIYSQFNSKAYAAGCEYLCLANEGHEIVSAQIAGPSVILVRGSENILISTSSDLLHNNYYPLPSKLFGLENVCYPQLNSFRVEEKDSILLISRSHLPKQLLNLDLRLPLSNLVQCISGENVQIPFWIGRLQI
jgi:hypothetical protein